MSRFFSIIIIFGILVIGGGWLWMRKSEDEARARMEESLASARRTFSDKARAAVGDKDEQDYLRNIKAALTSYESELKSKVYKEKPEWRDAEGYAKRVEERFKDGELQEAQKKSMLEGYEIVKDAHETLMAGTWTPVLTQASGGDTRIDLYGMKRTRDPDGNPLLEGKALFWGIEDTTRMNWGQLNLRYWVKRTKMVKKGRRKVEEEIEEVLGKAEGDATPRLIIQKPGQYISEFPAYVSVGRIWMPTMPREAFAVDVEYTYIANKGGGSYEAKLLWEKLPIPSAWKLEEGEDWDADVVEATEEEIAGTDGQKEDAGVEEEEEEATN